jgi:osmoprotectant transport system permease protein
VSNLGDLFTEGLYRGFVEEVVVGIVGIMLIALVFDAILVLIGRLLLPWQKADNRIRRAERHETVRAVTQA